ncbi:unnamed protein product [Camellia sinensis]
MELLKLSKFKLQLRALVTEVRELRKQKQIEEEFGRKLTELQAELALSNELRQKLERKGAVVSPTNPNMTVSYLQSDNALLENKQKELKGTINNLLQSRESFVKVYEDSTFEMKQSIQTSDRKEGIVAGLKSKMDKLSSYEKVFVEKISDLESKLRNDENELRRKEKVISQLEAQLEEAKIKNTINKGCDHTEFTDREKDGQALQLELRSLGIILQKIQDTVTNMNEEHSPLFWEAKKNVQKLKKRKISDMGCQTLIEDAYQNTGENSPSKAGEGGSEENTASVYKEHDSVNKRLQGNNNMECCISEFSCSSPQPTYSEPQSTPNVVSIAVTEAKDNCTTLFLG